MWDVLVTEIKIPEGVTSIREDAFVDTKWLQDSIKNEELVIVNNIVIACNKFEREIKIPRRVKSIGDRVFRG